MCVCVGQNPAFRMVPKTPNQLGLGSATSPVGCQYVTLKTHFTLLDYLGGHQELRHDNVQQ